MKKILSSLILTIALSTTSATAISGATLGVEFGQADTDIAKQSSVKARGVSLNAGWLTDSGLGFEISHAVFKDTIGSNTPYLDGVMNTNTKYEMEIDTLDLVKEFHVLDSLNLIAKVGLSNISVESNYREIYIAEPDIHELINITNYNDSSYTAKHAYLGFAYNSGRSSVTLGVGFHKSSKVKILTPNLGVRIMF